MLRSRLKVGKINCEKYRKVCEKAAVRGYPTVRYYRGGEGEQQYTSRDITERSPNNIVIQLDTLLREGEEPQPQPVNEDLDMKDIPLEENTAEEREEDFDEEDQNGDFVYFYDDDNEFHHDEL